VSLIFLSAPLWCIVCPIRDAVLITFIVLLLPSKCICTVSFLTVLYCTILYCIVCPFCILFFGIVFFYVFCLSGKQTHLNKKDNH